MRVVSPVVLISNFSSYIIFFNLPVAVNNSIKVGPLVLLLQMFIVTGNIIKRPVFVRLVSFNCVVAFLPRWIQY
jgi:hypothetical protein